MRKKSLSLLLCLLLLLPALTCSAASYTVTEDQLRTLESNLTRLQQINETLLLDSSQSTKDLLTVQSELTQSRQQLDTLKGQLLSLQSEVKLTQQDLQKASASLDQANKSFELYAKEQKSKQAGLKAQNVFWMAVAAGMGYLYIKK